MKVSGPLSLSQISRRDLTLIDLLDRILDKGVIINGDITVSIGKVELLSLKINLVIASLETAKRYGLRLPWEKEVTVPVKRSGKVTNARNYRVVS